MVEIKLTMPWGERTYRYCDVHDNWPETVEVLDEGTWYPIPNISVI